MSQPHLDLTSITINCAVITVSDTRTPDTDSSGELIQQLLLTAGHKIGNYQIIPDEPTQIRAQLDIAANSIPPISAIVFNGGTGISPRDRTYDSIANCLTKTIPGFGEIFRFLSYQDIGSRAISSRAIAGTYQHLLVFSLPGSRAAVKLGMEKLILPELVHLVTQLTDLVNASPNPNSQHPSPNSQLPTPISHLPSPISHLPSPLKIVTKA